VRGLTAAGAAIQAQQMLAEGEPLLAVWRYCLVQLLDGYTSEARRAGAEQASRRFEEEPAATGSAEVDAGLAGLAEHLARRDGWSSPAWVRATGRCAPAGCPARNETRSPRAGPYTRRPGGTFVLVRGAEDKRFELLRGCPQHAS
jgi:hypothetical protein